MFRLRLRRKRETATAPRYMYDGVAGDAAAIAKAFPNAEMIAGYTDGRFAWGQAEWNLFPHATHVYITVFASDNFGDIIDCETGDATPEQAAAWVRMRKAAGYFRPTIYCNLDTAPAVRVATGNLILGVDYDMWIAWYNGDPTQYVFSDGRKAVAKQYLSPQGSFYDKSSVYDSAWPHRTAPKPPAPQGPFRHVVPAGNTESLYRVARDRNLKDASSLVSLSRAHLGTNNLAVLNAYVALDDACVADGLDHAAMPMGLVYYTENP